MVINITVKVFFVSKLFVWVLLTGVNDLWLLKSYWCCIIWNFHAEQKYELDSVPEVILVSFMRVVLPFTIVKLYFRKLSLVLVKLLITLLLNKIWRIKCKMKFFSLFILIVIIFLSFNRWLDRSLLFFILNYFFCWQNIFFYTWKLKFARKLLALRRLTAWYFCF